ncbi:MAG: hypothetical protein ACRBF0_08935 [Calditrichia bacterium]
MPLRKFSILFLLLLAFPGCSEAEPDLFLRGYATSISFDSQKVLSYYRNGETDSIFVQHIHDGTILFEYELNENLEGLVFSKDAKILIFTETSLLELDWQLIRISELAKLDSMNITGIKVDYDANRLLWGNAPENMHDTTSGTSEIVEFDLSSRKLRRTSFDENFGQLYDIAPRSKDMLFLNQGGELIMVILSKSYVMGYGPGVLNGISLGKSSIHLSKNKKELVACFNEGEVGVLDIDTGKIRTLDIAGDYINPILSYDNKFIVAQEVTRYRVRAGVFSAEPFLK